MVVASLKGEVRGKIHIIIISLSLPHACLCTPHQTPRLCQFQYVGYELTLAQEGRDIEVLRQVTGTFSGSDNSNAKATNLTGVKLDDDKFYSAIINVKVDGRELPRKTTNCIAGTSSF